VTDRTGSPQYYASPSRRRPCPVPTPGRRRLPDARLMPASGRLQSASSWFTRVSARCGNRVGGRADTPLPGSLCGDGRGSCPASHPNCSQRSCCSAAGAAGHCRSDRGRTSRAVPGDDLQPLPAALGSAGGRLIAAWSSGWSSRRNTCLGWPGAPRLGNPFRAKASSTRSRRRCLSRL
jgi:hypothetical protein